MVSAFESPQTSQTGLYNEMLSQKTKREIKEREFKGERRGGKKGSEGRERKEKGKARIKETKFRGLNCAVV